MTEEEIEREREELLIRIVGGDRRKRGKGRQAEKGFSSKLKLMLPSTLVEGAKMQLCDLCVMYTFVK